MTVSRVCLESVPTSRPERLHLCKAPYFAQIVIDFLNTNLISSHFELLNHVVVHFINVVLNALIVMVVELVHDIGAGTSEDKDRNQQSKQLPIPICFNDGNHFEATWSVSHNTQIEILYAATPTNQRVLKRIFKVLLVDGFTLIRQPSLIFKIGLIPVKLQAIGLISVEFIFRVVILKGYFIRGQIKIVEAAWRR